MAKLPQNAIVDHVYGTYVTLRTGMACVAVVFPVLLYLWGKLHGIDLQDSMSAYYWATVEKGSPARIWFVGILFLIGGFLYLYKGFTREENWALNLAALFAIGVAFFPAAWPGFVNPYPAWLHGACAVSLFVCMAYVTWFRAGDTLEYLEPPALRARYGRRYKFASIAMLVAPLTAAVLQAGLGLQGKFVFFIELAGIWAFATFWFFKSREMAHTKPELRVIRKWSEAEPAHEPARAAAAL